MNRKIAIWGVATAAAFGLTACTGGATTTEATSEPVTPMVSSCLDIADLFTEAATGLNAGTKKFDVLAKTFDKIAKEAKDANVRSTASSAASDLKQLAELQTKVEAGDAAALEEYSQVSSSFQNNYGDLLSTCGPNFDVAMPSPEEMKGLLSESADMLKQASGMLSEMNDLMDNQQETIDQVKELQQQLENQ